MCSYGTNQKLFAVGLGFIIGVNDLVKMKKQAEEKPAVVKQRFLKVRLAINQELLKRGPIAEAFRIFVCINQIAVNSVSLG